MSCPAVAASRSETRVATKTPFYMYDPAMFDGNKGCNVSSVSSDKHNHVTFAIRAFSKHPWQTHARNATLFFIPLLVDYMSRGLCSGNAIDLIRRMAAKIRHLGYYPQKRHFIIVNVS